MVVDSLRLESSEHDAFYCLRDGRQKGDRSVGFELLRIAACFQKWVEESEGEGRRHRSESPYTANEAVEELGNEVASELEEFDGEVVRSGALPCCTLLYSLGHLRKRRYGAALAVRGGRQCRVSDLAGSRFHLAPFLLIVISETCRCR